MMYKPQDFASLQASNQSLRQQLEAISSRHRTALQQNQQLTSQNQRLQKSIQSHIQQDWNELKKEKEHFDFSGDHFSALMRVKEQLRNSLNALQKPRTSFENLHEFASEESNSEKQHNLLQDQYSYILELLRKVQTGSPAIYQELKAKLQSYHRSVVQIEEEHRQTKSRADRFEHQLRSMQESLKEAKEVNKNMYNQLLEVTLQLQNAERLKPQLLSLEEEREQLRTALQKLEKQKDCNMASKIVENDKQAQNYEEIRKCYEQIANLRLKLSEAQNSQRDDQTAYVSHKAELELANILSKKKLQESEKQVRELKDRLQKAETQLSQQSQGQKILEEYQQEIYLLKIKVFALESLQVGQRYKANKNSQLDDFLQKIRPWLEGGGDWKQEALQMMAETHSIVKQLEKKLEEEQNQTDRLRKKYKNFKQKCQLAEKNQRQKQEQLIESYSLKSKEYNKLMDKMQIQLERMAKTNTEKSIREMAQMLTVPLQQQLDIATTQNAYIHNELVMKEQLITQQSQRHQVQINQLLLQIEQLKQENHDLHRVNRQSQSMLLQQNLNLAVSKIQEKAQGKRSRLLSTEKSQTVALQQQITLLNSRLQEQADMLSKETVKNQKLTNLNNAQVRQLQQLKAELKQLKNQISESFVSNQSPRVNSMGNIDKQKDEQVRRLRAQLSQIKSQLYRERAFGEEMADRAEKSLDETRSYRKRIEQLQQVLKVIDSQSKEKGIQIMRLQHEKDVLQRQLQKLQEHLQTIKGKANSLKEIEWLQHNKQLQDQVQNLKKDNAEKLQLLIKRQREVQQLRIQCDSFLQDNLKLVCIVKEHDIQVKENLLFTQKYQEERNHKAKQLEKKISNLTQDNQILKNLVEELRTKLISVNAGTSNQSALTSDNSSDVTHLRIALVNAQNEARHYQAELQHLHQQRLEDKHAFQNDWEKLNSELNALSRELQFYRKGGITPFVGKGSFSSKGVTSEREGSEYADDFHDGKIVKSEIIDLMSELQIKNQVIRQLKQELKLAAYNKKDQIVPRPFQQMRLKQASYTQTSSKAIGISNRQIQIEDTLLRKESKNVAVGPDSEEEDRSDVYLRQLFQLREQNQKLMQIKLYNEDKLRDLEQQNNVLRLKLLAGQSTRYDYYSGDNKYNYGERSQLPAPMRLQQYSVHSSEHSTPPSYYEVNRSVSSNTEGRGSNPSIPEEHRSRSSIPEGQRSKTSIPESQVFRTGGNVTFKKQSSRQMSKEEISDMQALAPLVKSVEGQGMF